MLLAIDPGTKMGWATLDRHGNIDHGVLNLKARRSEPPGQRFLNLRDWLDSQHNVTTLCYEQVRRHAGTQAAHVYGGFVGILTAWAADNNIPCGTAEVGAIKKHWTGKGNASKEQMIKTGHQKGYPLVKDDNEMDAIALLHYWMEHGTFRLSEDGE